MFRAWSAGIGVLVIANTAWFVLVEAEDFSKSSVFLLWLSPLLAAFVTSYLGPSKKILLGTSIAVPTAILAVMLNSLYQYLGIAVDFPGLRGGLILFSTTLIYALVLSGIGGVLGYFLARK